MFNVQSVKSYFYNLFTTPWRVLILLFLLLIAFNSWINSFSLEELVRSDSYHLAYQRISEIPEAKRTAEHWLALGILYEHFLSLENNRASVSKGNLFHAFEMVDKKGYKEEAYVFFARYYIGLNDLKNAMIWIKKLDEINSYQGAYFRGLIYDDGKLVKKDIDKANAFYQKSSQHGSVDSSLRLLGFEAGRKQAKEMAFYFYIFERNLAAMRQSSKTYLQKKHLYVEDYGNFDPRLSDSLKSIASYIQRNLTEKERQEIMSRVKKFSFLF